MSSTKATPTQLIWEFVEQHYPNYSQCDDIMKSGDLLKIADEEFEIGDSAHQLFIEEFGGDMTLALLEMNNLNCKIYEAAIVAFMQKQTV